MAKKVDSLHQAVGGTAACWQLSAAFYARVERDAVLRPLFPGKNLHCAIEEFAAFLAQFLGGPTQDAQRRWWVSLRESHLRFRIGRKQRDAWMSNMAMALDDVAMAQPMRGALREFFEQSSAYVVNHGEACPADGGELHPEIALRWEGRLALDRAVAAVRKGDADGAIKLAEEAALREWFARDRSVCVGLLAVMANSGLNATIEYVRETLRRDPALALEQYGGFTLLRHVAAAADLPTVELLLRLGADPNAGAHTPLYSVGNACQKIGCGDVVRALVQGGADVNARVGVKHCTALHMAARRGNVMAAEALLACGAEIESRDSLGDTPLRRAVNCDRPEVAELLISRGADAHSVGSKGLTPRSAAKSAGMKRIVA